MRKATIVQTEARGCNGLDPADSPVYCGYMVDRLAPGRHIPSIVASRPLQEQFPLCVPVRNMLNSRLLALATCSAHQLNGRCKWNERKMVTKWNMRKIMLIRVQHEQASSHQ